MNPKVSVITTLYNYSEYIGDCITSFLNQDFEDAEMVIVDDASTDNPWEIIREFVDDRIQYIRLPENRNYSNAKNVGIKASKSEVLVMLDADDMLTPTGISTRYNELMKGFDLVHGPCLRQEVRGIRRDPMWEKWLNTADPLWIHAQGVMLRKNIHRIIGLYDPWFWAQGDREMFLRIGNAGFTIGAVDTDVAVYRIHSRQMYKSKRKKRNRQILDIRMRKVLAQRKDGDFSGIEMLRDST
jgi:glycosyltransferase involved in cell wall biosynthesis